MKKYLLLVMAVAWMMVGCSKIDLDAISKQTIGTSLATPIGTIDATVFDLYSKFDTLIELQYNEDNTIFLYWEQPIQIDEFNLKDFTQGQQLTGSYRLFDDPSLQKKLNNVRKRMGTKMPPITIELKDTLKYRFNFNEDNDSNRYMIDNILIRKAKINLGIEMTGIELDENNYIEAELSFPTLIAQKPVAIQAHVATSVVDLERQIGSFIATFGNDTVSAIDMYITFKLVTDGSATITPDATISYATSFSDIEYDIIYGYIYSTKPITSNHTTIGLGNIEQLYEFVEKNVVSLYNPEFIIELTTNLGLDAKLDVKEISTKTRTGHVTKAKFGGKDSFEKRIESAQSPGSSATTTLTLDRNFGQMNELFKEIPDSLILDWDIMIGEETPSHNNFIIDPIQLDAKFAIRVPVWFDKGTDINFEDTLDADLTGINGDWTNYVDMQKFEIFLNFQNTLPIQGYASLEFMDSLGNTLFDAKEIEIACPPVDDLGRSQEVAEKEVTLSFTDEEIGLILQTKKIALHYQIQGHDNESTINFHATDGLRVKISAYATATISTSKKEK